MLVYRGMQGFFIISIIVAIAVSIFIHSAYIVNTPIAHWKFDGDLADNGKYRYEAIGEAKFVIGKHGQALHLAGGDPIIIKDNPAIRLQGPFTLSLWAKNNELSAFAGLIGRGYGQSDIGGYQIYNNNGELRFKVDSQNIPIAVFNDVTGYHLITITYDGETIKGYIDGILTKSEQTRITTHINSYDLVLGIPPGTAAFKGNIDDLRIYDKALSPLDILIMAWS